MAAFGKTSSERLATAHHDLQLIFNEVIKHFDCTIVSGRRSPEEQFELYKKGRIEQNGQWLIDNKAEIVTSKDGYNNKSKHNYTPSMAVDAVPYPIDWKDKNRMRHFAGFVKGVAAMLLADGRIKSRVRWGGDWDNDTDLNDQLWNDLPHFELY